MIHNPEYIKALIRKEMEGELTQSEQAMLMVAEKLHDEDQWFRMTVEVLSELEDDLPSVHLKGWRPDFAKIRAGADQRRSRKRVFVFAARLAGVIGVGLLVGFFYYNTGGDESGDIPSTEFACTVHWGDSASLTVDRSSRGRLGRIRNIEVRREPDGVLALIPSTEATIADTIGYPAIRIVTAAHQQCIVRLPDGSEIRLNAGSSLAYPLWNMDRNITYAQLKGQALVHVREPADRQQPVTLVIETSNSQLQTAKGKYAVTATPWNTEAVLLAGRMTAFSPMGKERQELIYGGDQVEIRTCCTNPEGMANTIMETKCVSAEQAITWTKAMRIYHNVPLKKFVAEMSRWYGIKVENIDCIPDGPRITAAVDYQAPLYEIYAHIYKAGVFIYEGDGMISFCNPEMNPMERQSPWAGELLAKLNIRAGLAR
ncbi:MAG TPA: FecR family protein [Parapedobacter sp.]|nr:FecR family protein [Parapedobacter sp.]